MERSFLVLVIIRITDLNMVFIFRHNLFDFTVLVKDELKDFSGGHLFISAGHCVKRQSSRYLKFSCREKCEEEALTENACVVYTLNCVNSQ